MAVQELKIVLDKKVKTLLRACVAYNWDCLLLYTNPDGIIAFPHASSELLLVKMILYKWNIGHFCKVERIRRKTCTTHENLESMRRPTAGSYMEGWSFQCVPNGYIRIAMAYKNFKTHYHSMCICKSVVKTEKYGKYVHII